MIDLGVMDDDPRNKVEVESKSIVLYSETESKLLNGELIASLMLVLKNTLNSKAKGN